MPSDPPTFQGFLSLGPLLKAQSLQVQRSQRNLTPITAEKCQDGFIGQGRRRTDTGSQSESEEFTEPSSAVISALDESFDDDTDWHVDINIVLSANEFRADVLQFIHRLDACGT